MTFRALRNLAGAALFSLVLLALSGLSISASQALSANSLSSNVRGVSPLGPLPTCSVPSWNVVPSPNTGASPRLAEVAVVSSNDVWAVGDSSGGTSTLTLHWDGTEWTIVPSPNPGLSNNSLSAVVAIAPDDVWAVGRYRNTQTGPSQALALHWDGISWNVVSTPSLGFGTTLTAITALASDNVWAAGEYVPDGRPDVLHPVSMHWDGTTWTIISMPTIPGCGDPCLHTLPEIVAIASDDIWAVGTYFGGQRFITLTEHWDGISWSIVSSPNPGPLTNRLIGVTAISHNDVWAVGYYSPPSAPNQTLTLHWNGVEWSQVPSTNAGSSSNNLHDVDALASNDIWAIGTYLSSGVEQTLSLHWDGTQWAVVPSPNAGTGLNRVYGIAAVSADDVWAVGYHSSTPHQTLTLRYNGNCITPTVPPSATTTVSSTSTPTGTPIVTASVTRTPTTHTKASTSTATMTVTSTATSCPVRFSDVDENHTFYANIRCLACRGIVSGYSDGTFRPNSEVTRGQLAKMVSNAAGFSEPPTQQTFEDVPPSNIFYEWIERLTIRGYMTGYNCGGPGEPCTTGKPYFRPFANATRGQTSKIVSNAAMFTEPAVGQTFEDVPPTHTFYEFIQRLATRNVMGGYECGGAGEPCTSGKPYFRPGNDVTRGQSAKIVANTFFPGCEALSQP